jgi:hypothetical protein
VADVDGCSSAAPSFKDLLIDVEIAFYRNSFLDSFDTKSNDWGTRPDAPKSFLRLDMSPQHRRTRRSKKHAFSLHNAAHGPLNDIGEPDSSFG